jgi:superfamily I DNA and/or RNA helicase
MPSLNYIYGPPGTGKTTTLCNNINSIIKENPNAKILVLTPTNKASDVVCKKLLDINTDILAVRLSRPTDSELEEYSIYRDTISEVDMKSINVVASTIHRLPYFDIQNAGLLFQYKWDYVIFDESSMTGLHYITFALMALFKTNPDVDFIIAGDPKQIPPVIEIDDKELENFEFQDECIYKMMKLESFNPEEQSIRDIDSIENLETQYRSVPEIGQLFSELSYLGLLKHDREINRKESKPLPEAIKSLISSNVTFIDIPLNKDNSIYKVNKLFYSSYQTYCAIMVTEIVKYFDAINTSENWTIGLIAPYKAQAILLNKLVTSYGISEKIKVYSDTVHGFQGDECDIVFFVCNPNNYYYTGHEKSLLSKEYIYNVAISRAKDYLVILHPYTTIPNNMFINEIGDSFKKNFGNARILNSKEVEKILFDDENYIENNSYVSGHDNVNVFGLSEMKYFIKSNDTAIDIQLRNLNNS